MLAIAETMTDGNFGAVPVVRKDFMLAGLVPEFDLIPVREEEEIVSFSCLPSEFIRAISWSVLPSNA